MGTDYAEFLKAGPALRPPLASVRGPNSGSIPQSRVETLNPNSGIRQSLGGLRRGKKKTCLPIHGNG
jgi:hypothetical protein